ncbi:uncharacterized protein LOC111913900 [Lactuca sativa]|uniref:uncharacterized protein LOC111913900 n=1 Tax=Lactuca sativa TaxID=4236 RepID=UPI000CC62F2A|nr:uncharacterized protein LOC111913900 [Lactuca sativa]XP_023765380.1 uncharacterized protein LOC111913900 [Lactuca sativa]XP_023765381.1 uncharacterized protein LOC111913900 [Lactuca sativa]
MEFLKMRKFRKAHKPNPEKESDNNPVPVPGPEEPKKDNDDDLGKSATADVDNATEADEDDDDFIMNEVKRRLKELRRNSFMVLIPEETCPEEEEPEEEEEDEGQASSNEWRDVEAEGRQLWSCFGAFYDKYCERMLFFDRLTTQLLKEIGSLNPSTPSPRSVSKKLTSPLRCLSLKKFEPPEDETEHLQQQPENDPYLDLETAYVSQLCLTWEALHCQYSQLSQIQSENSKCYNHSAQQFQQFQVLLQRFIENEPFERGLRPEVYGQTRNSLSKLLQVPNILGQDRKEMTEEESEMVVEASDLLRIIETSILTFQLFIKMDKKKSNGVRNLFGGQNQMVTPVQQVQASLEKKKVKLKELWKKRKGGKKNQWPGTQEEVELLLGVIDVKVINRVLRMVKISKDQLFWSEEKMKKLDLSAASGKLQRDPSPILFPC